MFEDAEKTGVRVHTMLQSEVGSDRRINPNSAEIASHTDQQAILIFNGGEAPQATPTDPIRGGSVPCRSGPDACIPNMIGASSDWDFSNNVKIFETTLRRTAPQSPNDEVFDEGLRSVFGHEFGHCVGIPHNDAERSSIMWFSFSWSQIYHDFLAADLRPVRLK